MRKYVITAMLWAYVIGLMAQTDSISNRIHLIDTVKISTSVAQRSLSSTAPMHLINKKSMVVMGISDFTDALHRLPGITLRDYGGAGGMKTVAVRGYGSQHTGVSYDGVMLSNSQNGDIDLSRYTLDNIESLSLSVGDYSDLFVPARQTASASTLNINTWAMPLSNQKPQTNIQTRVGSFDYISVFAQHIQPITAQLDLMANMKYVFANNDYPYTLYNIKQIERQNRKNSKMNALQTEFNSLWKGKHGEQVKGKIYYYDNSRQLPGVVKYYTTDSKETLHDRNFFTQWQYQMPIKNKVLLKIVSKFNWASAIYREGKFDENFADANYFQREWYASACLLYAFSKDFSFNYSADYIFNNLNSTIKTDKKPWRHTVLQSVSVKYSTLQVNILARLLASLYYNGTQIGTPSDDFKRLSPSLSLSYQPIKSQQVYLRASYKNIFRTPNFTENYFYHHGVDNLKPEITNQVNVGIATQQQYKQLAFHGSLDTYYNSITDKIIAIPINMFVWRNFNLGKARIVGTDFVSSITYELRPKHKLTWATNYSYQQAQNRTSKHSPYYNNQIAYTPKHSGSTSFAYENPWLNLTLHVTGASNVWSNNEHYLETRIKGYTDWGLMAQKSIVIADKPLSLQANINNLFNQQYEIIAGYPMPGIHWKFSIEYQF